MEVPDDLTKDSFGHPCLEAPRVVIEHYLRGPSLKNFDTDEVGFFTFKGVKVYEQGKKKGPFKEEKVVE